MKARLAWSRKGRGCVDQIFAIKIMVEEYLWKGEKLYAAFMDLEKTFELIGNVLKIHGVEWQLLT